MRLIDAVWIWTEPHSMRLKVKISVQKEVFNGTILQQSAVIEFVVRNQQCEHCQKEFAQGAWHAVVQVLFTLYASLPLHHGFIKKYNFCIAQYHTRCFHCIAFEILALTSP
jgi:hypothetical protein